MASITSENLIKLVNQSRVNAGLKPLNINLILTKAAQKKAEDMAKRGYFSHNDPDGKPGYSLIGESGYNYNLAAENLAEGYSDSESINNAWLNSESHRKHLLSSDYQDTGIAVVPGKYNGKDSFFTVQFFGSPKQEKVKPSLKLPAQTTQTTPAISTSINPAPKLKQIASLKQAMNNYIGQK